MYLNDLGVTEMRLGELQRAKRRFHRALDLDAKNEVARENLAELAAFMSPADFAIGMNEAYPQMHRLTDLPELSARDLMRALTPPHPDSPAATEPLILQAPFIVRGALQDWGWKALTSEYAKKLSSTQSLSNEILSALVATFGDKRTDFYPHGMADEHSRPYFATLKEAVGYLEHPRGVYTDVDASMNGTYIQFNMDTATFAQLVTLLARDRS
jgi:hypothetical protein